MPPENQRPVSGNPNAESEDDDSNRWDHYSEGSPQKWWQRLEIGFDAVQ